jgi:hypothetical protein
MEWIIPGFSQKRREQSNLGEGIGRDEGAKAHSTGPNHCLPAFGPFTKSTGLFTLVYVSKTGKWVKTKSAKHRKIHVEMHGEK